MVLYYSATGNSKYVAEIIAKELDDKTLDLRERIKSGDHSKLYSDKPFVLCCPVYVCEMPRFLMHHLAKQKFAGNRMIYFVFTCGGYGGVSGTMADEMFRNKKMLPMGHAEIVMPNNYVASDHYKPNDEEEILYRIENAAHEARAIALRIKTGRKLSARHIFLFEKIVTLPFTPVWTRLMQPSKPFRVSDKCAGCGKCAALCPVNNITLVDKKPVWNAPCAHCMACICNCPVEAIDYGDVTQKKDKYNIRRYLAMIHKEQRYAKNANEEENRS